MSGRIRNSAMGGLATLLIAGCMSASVTPQVQPVVSEPKLPKLPAWVDHPCIDKSQATVCGVGISEFAAADLGIAKADAELAAKAQIATQIEDLTAHMTMRYGNAVNELSTKQKLGNNTFEIITESSAKQALVGLRFVEYFYYPDAANPQRVYVRALLTPDYTRLSQRVIIAMIESSKAENLPVDSAKVKVRLQGEQAAYFREEDLPLNLSAPPPVH